MVQLFSPVIYCRSSSRDYRSTPGLVTGASSIADLESNEPQMLLIYGTDASS
jgi:hypothetical protein